MTDAIRNAIAASLEHLANQESWNPEAWQLCYDSVTANWGNELLGYVHDDLTHYSGVFYSHNILGLRTKPDSHELDDYRYEFRSIAAALRAQLSLADAKKQFRL